MVMRRKPMTRDQLMRTIAQKKRRQNAMAYRQGVARRPQSQPRKRATMDNTFDKVFVLNLDKHMDKWFNMVRRLDGLGVKNYERFPAINGYSEPYKSQWTRYSKKPFNVFDKRYGRKAIRSPGVWGILNSMRSMFMLAKERGYKNFLVLQDDCLFHHNFNNLFAKKIPGIPTNWKMLYLGVTQYGFSSKQKTDNGTFYHPLGQADGAFAVAFDKSIYDYAIREINRFVMPFDSGPLMTIQRNFKSDVYVVSPYLVIADVRTSSCRSGRSQIDFCKKVRWDYSKFEEFVKVPDNPLVSVVMVLDNSARFVEDSLESLLNQTYSKLEIIVIDNASEDGSADLVSTKSPKIKLLKTTKKMPENVLRNIGVMVARGSVTMFHSGNSKALLEKVEKQLNILKKTNGVVIGDYNRGAVPVPAQSLVPAQSQIIYDGKVVEDGKVEEIDDETVDNEIVVEGKSVKFSENLVEERIIGNEVVDEDIGNEVIDGNEVERLSYESMMFSRKVVDEFGYLGDAGEYEYYERARRLGVKTSVSDFYYLYYKAMSEGDNTYQERPSDAIIEAVDKKLSVLETKKGPLYHPFPKDADENILLDITRVVAPLYK